MVDLTRLADSGSDGCILAPRKYRFLLEADAQRYSLVVAFSGAELGSDNTSQDKYSVCGNSEVMLAKSSRPGMTSFVLENRT